MNSVSHKADSLPERELPPAMIRLLPVEYLQDTIQPQNNATPVYVFGSLEEASANVDVTRHNAIVHENSSMD